MPLNRRRKRVKQNRIIKAPSFCTSTTSVGGLLLTVYKPVGEFANERQDTCVDITLNDWPFTPPGSELWILCNSNTKELLLSSFFPNFASCKN